jgi:hypothetical protein
LPSAALLVMVAIFAVRQIDANRYKPLWLLLREADRPALLEINRRLAANQLSRPQVDRVTAAALAVQADTNKPFLLEWGTFVEVARAAGEVDDESWQRYARQALPLQVIARANVRRGDPVPIQFHYGPARVGRGYHFHVDISIVRSSLAGVPLAGTTRTGMSIDYSYAGTDLSARLSAPADKLAALADGPNPLKVVARIAIDERTQPMPSTRYEKLLSHDVESSTTINLLPADQPTVEIVPGDDKAMRAEIEALLVLKGYRTPREFMSWDHGDGGFGRHVQMSKDHWGNDVAQFLISPTRPMPVGLACDIAVIDPAGRTWPSDTITIGAGASNGGWVCDGEWEGFNADKVEVVLTPNPAAAAATVGITKMFGGVIRFKDVPVVWDKEVHRPTTMPTGGRSPHRPATTKTTTSTSPATTKSTR